MQAQLHSFLTSVKMEVRGQNYAPANIRLKKNPGTHWTWGRIAQSV